MFINLVIAKVTRVGPRARKLNVEYLCPIRLRASIAAEVSRNMSQQQMKQSEVWAEYLEENPYEYDVDDSSEDGPPAWRQRIRLAMVSSNARSGVYRA